MGIDAGKLNIVVLNVIKYLCLGIEEAKGRVRGIG